MFSLGAVEQRIFSMKTPFFSFSFFLVEKNRKTVINYNYFN